MDLFDIAIAKKLAGGGGGGSSNVVMGTFKGTENGAMDVTIPYTGEGWPVNLVITPKEGPHNPNGSEFYPVKQAGAIAIFTAEKRAADASPTWTGTDIVDNYCSLVGWGKTATGEYANQPFKSTGIVFYAPSGLPTVYGTTDVARFKSSTTLSVWISSTAAGFVKDVEYTYMILYSS